MLLKTKRNTFFILFILIGAFALVGYLLSITDYSNHSIKNDVINLNKHDATNTIKSSSSTDQNNIIQEQNQTINTDVINENKPYYGKKVGYKFTGNVYGKIRGAPIPNAMIEVIKGRKDNKNENELIYIERSALLYADKKGEFSFKLYNKGFYAIIATYPDTHTIYDSTEVSINDNHPDTNYLAFTLDEGTEIKGIIRDENGFLLKNIEVYFFDSTPARLIFKQDNIMSTIIGKPLKTITNDNGEYSFVNIFPSSDYDVAKILEEYHVNTKSPALKIYGREKGYFSQKWDISDLYSGKVKYHDITLRKIPTKYMLKIKGAVKGSASDIANAKVYFVFIPTVDNYNLDLSPEEEKCVGKESSYLSFSSEEIATDENGAYECIVPINENLIKNDIIYGQVIGWAYAEDYKPITRQNIATRFKKSEIHYDFQLSEEGLIAAGYVYNHEGNPIENVQITVTHVGDKDYREAFFDKYCIDIPSPQKTIKTDDKGRFVVSGLGETDYHISVMSSLDDKAIIRYGAKETKVLVTEDVIYINGQDTSIFYPPTYDIQITVNIVGRW